MFNDIKRILVLAPHTDDAEIGCGGTIAKLLEAKKEVFWAVFSKASTEKKYPPGTIRKELKKSAKVIGVKSENLFIYNFPGRRLSEHRQKILQKMRKLKNKKDKKKIKPDLVFMPSLKDVHQDHFTIAQEGLRAFKRTSILCYEEPWNNLNFNTSCLVHLEERHVKKKIEAIKKYRSQKKRPYVNEKKFKFMKSLARVRGVQAGVQYAEAFEVLRWVIK